MLGYSEKKLFRLSIVEIVLPEDYPQLEQLVDELIAENKEHSRLEMRYRRKDGSIAWANVSLSLLRDENNHLQYILGLIEDVTDEKAAAAELEEMHHRLLESVENERLRLAQELHDGPLQDLYGAVFSISNYLSDEKDPHLAGILKEVQETSKNIAGTLRNVCGELRPPTIANLGLERAIRSHAESIQDRHPELQLDLQLSNDGQNLPSHMRMAFFRIYQQCMTNILRHAHATKALVSFYINDHEVSLDVWDNGKGFTLPEKWVDFLREGHYGLAGIAERVDALDGTMKIDTRPGAGTLVHITAPRR